MNEYTGKEPLQGQEDREQNPAPEPAAAQEERGEHPQAHTPGASDASGSWHSGQQARQQPYGYTGYNPPYYGQGAPQYPPRQQAGQYPAQGYYRNQGAYGYGQTGYPPPQQQYGTSSGWQQKPPAQDQYEWKFEDYEKFDAKKEKKRRNRGLVVFTVAILCVLTVGLVGLAAYSVYTVSYEVAGSEEALPWTEGEALPETAVLPPGELEITARPEIAETLPVGERMSIPQVAKAVLPSVVGVITYNNDQYYDIGNLGSGIVMSEDGYIITNAHVVAEGTGFKVQLYNGDPYDAVLIGSDALTDLAVLKIEATGLSPAQFGDSDEIEVGETVVAIGNPAGLELAGSVTRGIVSAVGREVLTTNTVPYIQTDAAINPGNSGGALANEFGQVIGINSSKIIASGYEGIGFAIPIKEAKPVVDDIILNGRVTGRVMLGITCRTIDDVDARKYGVQKGLSIESVHAGSDLASAGVLKGDILTHIDGERIYTHADVQRVLKDKNPGETVTLILYRRIGTETEVEVRTRLMESE